MSHEDVSDNSASARRLRDLHSGCRNSGEHNFLLRATFTSSTSSVLANENLLVNEARLRENVGDDGNEDGLHFSYRLLFVFPSSFNLSVTEVVLHEDDEDDDDVDKGSNAEFGVLILQSDSQPLIFEVVILVVTEGGVSTEDDLNLVYGVVAHFLISDGLSTGSTIMEER